MQDNLSGIVMGPGEVVQFGVDYNVLGCHNKGASLFRGMSS